MPAPLWKVEPADGPHLERCLNDLVAAGYNVYQIIYCGSKVTQNHLDPNQQTMIPFVLVVGHKMSHPLYPAA